MTCADHVTAGSVHGGWCPGRGDVSHGPAYIPSARDAHVWLNRAHAAGSLGLLPAQLAPPTTRHLGHRKCLPLIRLVRTYIAAQCSLLYFLFNNDKAGHIYTSLVMIKDTGKYIAVREIGFAERVVYQNAFIISRKGTKYYQQSMRVL